MSRALVIIPTYNEIENIEKMLNTVMALPGGYEVLIVDDGSPDGTADVVRKLMDVHGGRIHLEERTGKLGLGTAYIHGFKWALAREYAHIFEMDCDFSHNPEDLPRLLEACENDPGNRDRRNDQRIKIDIRIKINSRSGIKAIDITKQNDIGK